MKPSEYIKKYLEETAEIAKILGQSGVERISDMIIILQGVKAQGGRLFFLGVGGGAGSSSHAANDFNKIAGIQTICLSDNVSLLTALTNDEGWDSVFLKQLEMQKLNPKDCLFIYSVGGGTETASKNLVLAIDYAKNIGAKVLGVVGKDTGATAQKADACIVVPCPEVSRRTAHTEDFQLISDHLLANLLAELMVINEPKPY